jgi:hypothetical protein
MSTTPPVGGDRRNDFSGAQTDTTTAIHSAGKFGAGSETAAKVTSAFRSPGFYFSGGLGVDLLDV